MSRNLLVIGGASPGGLGEDIALMAYDRGNYGEVRSTSQATYDVRSYAGHILNAEKCRNRGPDLDIVYVAGVNHLGKLGDLSPRLLLEQFKVNVIGFIMMLDAFKIEFENCKVNVVAVVSDSSRIPMRGSIGYASSKAALAHAIKCAARELAPTWRVNGVSPGIIADTPMTAAVDAVVPGLRGWTEEEAQAYERSLIPMGRRVTKEEVSSLVLSTLSGPEFMTGSIIDITGGK